MTAPLFRLWPDLVDSSFGAFLHPQQLVAPVTLEGARPFVERPDRLGIRAIEPLAARAAHAHQTHIPENAQVLRYRRLPEPQGRRDLPHRPLAHRQIAEDLP